MNKPVQVDYFSDVLCVWAWIAQRRVEELEMHFDEKIEVRYRYMDLFGNVGGKITTQWADRDGFSGFADHVQHAVSDYTDAPVNSLLWHQVRPATSANAHLYLKAVELSAGATASRSLALAIRKACFIDARDIGDFEVLDDLLEQQGIDRDAAADLVHSGAAIAMLMDDYQAAKQMQLKGSPSYVLDAGRQTLFGNVGYRVIHANVEELLKQPASEASWC